MQDFNWEAFWEEYPVVQKGNAQLLNVRPTDYDFKKAFDNLDKNLHFKKDDSVLDVGCGTGEIVSLLLPRVALAIGVDLSRAMNRIAMMRHPKGMFVRMAAHNLNFMDEKFDKVLCMGTIQHVPYDLFEKSIDEMLRVLKPGGKLCVADVLVEAPPEAAVFVYPPESWKKYKNIKIVPSFFKQGKRIDVVITK